MKVKQMGIKTEDILFVVNPKSGTKKPEWVINHLRKNIPDLNYIVPESVAVCHSLLDENVNMYKVFVAVGGDGTVHSLVPHVLQNNKILAILPYGSGNGFARELGFKKEISKLLKAFEKAETRDIDLIKVDDDFSINVAGLGFDSEVAHAFHHGFM